MKRYRLSVDEPLAPYESPEGEWVRYEEDVEALVREIEVLRLYGNKDCTAMADALLAKERASAGST